MIIFYATVSHICLLFRSGDGKVEKSYKERLVKIPYGSTEVCPDRIDGGGRKSLKEIDSEAHQHNREFTPIEEVHL